MSTDTVADAIARAFEDVPFPEGGISSCPCSQCEEVDASFRGIPWKAITPELMGSHPLHLTHFNHAAFRYYLPAYLLLALGETEEARESRFYTVFALGSGHSNYPVLRAGREARNGTFSPSQVEAIVAFLEHVSLTDGDVRQDACLARDEVWLPLLRTMSETEVERTDRVIRALVHRAADRFAASLKKFKPWQGENAITERNLTFQLATEFVAHFSDGFAFMEVPFGSQDEKRMDRHLDAYMSSAKLTVLLECKRVWAREQIDSIAADMARLSPALLGRLRTSHRALESQVEEAVGMILAETWRLEISEWWCGETARKPRWAPDLLPREGWKYGSKAVFKEHDGPGGTLYWLYAYKRFSPEPTAPTPGGMVSARGQRTSE